MSETARRVGQAAGRESADLVIRGVRVLNVFTGAVEGPLDIAVTGGIVAGLGAYNAAAREFDGRGLIAIPGLIDGHIHVESSMLTPSQFCAAVAPRGTTAVVCDPHEIANVSGIEGVRYILEASAGLPTDFFVTAPSCVPATSMETSGAELDADAIREILSFDRCVGLGEMMNFPGVLFADPGVMSKLEAASGRHVDGHAPGLSGASLAAYAGAGPCTDHESTSAQEGREKLAVGMRLMIREGSSERNIEALAPLVNEFTFRRCSLVSDDRSALDLRDQGHLDHILRRAVACGIPAAMAVSMASFNTAREFGLDRYGAIAPGYFADIALVNDLESFEVEAVFKRGRLTARAGALLEPLSEGPPGPRSSVRIPVITAESFRIPLCGKIPLAIGVIPGQIITRRIEAKVGVEGGFLQPDLSRDLIKLAVIERHRGTGRISSSLVNGLGMKRGAIASTVAHDSHNLIVAGCDDRDMAAAAEAVARAGGGQCYAEGGQARELLPLPVAGLLSDRPLDEVCAAISRLRSAVARAGCELEAPFEALSFLALPVIPELRLTDMGLVDVNAFAFVK